MNAITNNEGESRSISPAQEFRQSLRGMADQFANALPSHMKPEKFERVVMTAVMADPNILKANRGSLFEACMRAAQDGLLPDRSEGAFVVFGGIVQWMPMIKGVIKKLHQSGDLALITAKVVCAGDEFRSWVDDTGEHVIYEQGEDRDFGTVRQVFAMARTKDGTVYVETLTPRDVEKIRNVSRSKDKGPWKDWWEEMAKKSAIRRLAKRLPISSEMHEMLERDNGLYDLSRAPEPRASLADRMQLSLAQRQDGSPAREGLSREFGGATPAQITSELSTAEDVTDGEVVEGDDLFASDGGQQSDTKAIDPEAAKVLAEAKQQCRDMFLKLAGNPDKLPVEDLCKTLKDARKAWNGEMPTETAFIGRLADNAERIARGQDTDGKARRIIEEAV